MARQEFLDNVRAARNLFVHDRGRVYPADSPIDSQSLERRKARAAIWLVPKSVAEFDADDFRGLGPDHQRELAEAVRDFREVAEQVPPSEAATPDQLSRASSAFARLVGLLDPYLPTPEEVLKVREAIATIDLPGWVDNWNYELGNDHDEEPAVWVTIIADEHDAPRKQFARFSSELTAKLHRALSAFGIDRWPYVRMRLGIEQKSLA